jgi:hypothetical protein
MKKLLIIFLFISNLCFSQGHHTTIFRDSKLTDSILANGQNKLYIRSDIVGIYTRDTVRVLVDSLGNIKMYGDVEMYQDLGVTGNIQTLGDITGGNITATSGVFTGSGTGLTNVDAITLKGQDTTHFARTDASTTENINGAWTFWNIVRCIGVVTFDVSPIFNALVNFANGINVTGNATVSGDLVLSGWTKNQSSTNRDQYEKIKILRSPMSATGTTVTMAHGLDAKTISSVVCQIRDDSSGITTFPGNSFQGAGMLFTSYWMDATNINVRVAASMINLDDAADTVKVRITYTDYNR